MSSTAAFKPPVNDSFRDFDAVRGAAAGPSRPAAASPSSAAPAATPSTRAAPTDDLAIESAMARKFEALYAELNPPPAASNATADLDGLSFEFPPDLPSPPPVMEARSAPRPTGGEPYMERPAVARAQGAEPRVRSRDQDSSLDDALAVLRTAEARGKAANARMAREAAGEDDDESAIDPARGRGPGIKPLSVRTDAPATPLESRARVAANESWSERSQSLWPKVLGAAALALVIGTGLGYFYGTGQGAGDSNAKIQVTPEGGTQLKVERELKGR